MPEHVYNGLQVRDVHRRKELNHLVHLLSFVQNLEKTFVRQNKKLIRLIARSLLIKYEKCLTFIAT